MQLKSISLITAGLVILAVLLSFLDRPPAPTSSDDPRVGQPLISIESLRNVAALEISGADGQPVRVERRGNQWVVTSEDGLPADVDRLRRTMAPFAEGRITRFVTARPERKESLDLDRSRLVLNAENGDPMLDLRIGRSASGGGVYVQPADSERAYLFDQNLSLSTSPTSWTDRMPFDFEAEDVQRITVDFPSVGEGDTLTFERTGPDEEWDLLAGPQGASVNVPEVTTLLGNLAGLRMTRHIHQSEPEAVEARSFSRAFDLEMFDGSRITIRAGRRPAGIPPADWAEPPSEDDPPPNLADGDKADESPAGAPFFFAEIQKDGSPWSKVAREFAFALSEWNFDQLPSAVSDLVEISDPAP